MKPDLYTKTVLTVIAVMLTLIAFKTVVNPGTTASAQANFNGVQFSMDQGRPAFFDPHTGQIRVYGAGGQVAGKFHLSQLGDPLTIE